MALVGQREKKILWFCAVPMGLLALSCLYPIFFAVNTALKDNKGYILNRFGVTWQPSFDNFITAWGRARFSEYFLNSVTVTLGAVFLRCSPPPSPGLRWPSCASPTAVPFSW
jgi:ABC-type glycerol-3-phosphate transport system permease component